MKLKTKFQDKDFELGEVVKARAATYYDENKVLVMADIARGGVSRFEYNSIKDFTDHWEDVPEEPKTSALDMMILTLANFIENEPDEDKVDLEDCKQMLEKLKAWKRLKDKGFKFKKWESYEETSDLSFPDRHIVNSYTVIFDFNKPCRKYEIEDKVKDDLDLLFSGGEE